ncbi:DUF4123 domain-containing protein [Nissabacter archeti]|uniref:DUF4123 domain-containing protein n=1 Tax=Nissabacter archeti TaxID=1917880 RepID=UPI000934C121|nr:DUF4123 domain-containing protein [Nissabacter archeti]
MTINYLEHHRSLEKHQYAVIDRARLPVLPGNWPYLELVSPMLAPQAHLYPWLIPLHELPTDELNDLMAALSRHAELHSFPVCSLLLSSTLSLHEVRNVLTNALYFKDAKHRGYILRYYDPRVLFHLHWMLSPWQLFTQLPAQEIPYWTFWLEGKWHTLEFPGQLFFRPGEAIDFPLEQLQRCGEINRVFSKLPYSTDMAQRQKTSRRIDALLIQAMQCGLTSQEDRIAFALHGMTQREAFWHAPKMAAFLTQARLIPGFYSDETNGWDERRWQDMTQG